MPTTVTLKVLNQAVATAAADLSSRKREPGGRKDDGTILNFAKKWSCEKWLIFFHFFPCAVYSFFGFNTSENSGDYGGDDGEGNVDSDEEYDEDGRNDLMSLSASSISSTNSYSSPHSLSGSALLSGGNAGHSQGALFFTNFQLIFAPYQTRQSSTTILDPGCIRLPLCTIFQVTQHTSPLHSLSYKYPTSVLQISGKNLLILRFQFSTTYAFEQALKWANVMAFPGVKDMFAFFLKTDEYSNARRCMDLDYPEQQTITSKGIRLAGVLGSPYRSTKAPRTFPKTKTNWKMDGYEGSMCDDEDYFENSKLMVERDGDFVLEEEDTSGTKTAKRTLDMGSSMSSVTSTASLLGNALDHARPPKPQIVVYDDWKGVMSPQLKKMIHMAEDMNLNEILLDTQLQDVYAGKGIDEHVLDAEYAEELNESDEEEQMEQGQDEEEDEDEEEGEEEEEDGEEVNMGDSSGSVVHMESSKTQKRPAELMLGKKLQRAKSFVVTQAEDLESLDYSCEIPGCGFDYYDVEGSTQPCDQHYIADGWKIYDPEREFDRQGINDDGSYFRMSSVNAQYEICRTYPSMLAVPADITDEHLGNVAKFRSKGRLPSVSWIHPRKNVVLMRCAQPLVGMTNARSLDDEYLVRVVYDMQPTDENLVIVDCRPKANAVANTLRGGGYESTTVYENCDMVFANIDNIHVMRSSLNRLMDLCSLVTPDAMNGTLNFQDSGWLSKIEATNWLDHVRLVLQTSLNVAQNIHLQRRSVLVHCSDGWDRTSQVSALAQVLLDPYYRTIEGFEVLIEKEWCSFGHKFAQRLGHGDKQYWNDERSPVFLQFMDCVHQLLGQFPTAFEFNENFLIAILDHLYSCQFGTFLCNCERERNELGMRSKTVSVWSCINHYIFNHNQVEVSGSGKDKDVHRMFMYTNPFYVGNMDADALKGLPKTVRDQKTKPILSVDCSSVSMVLWRSYYLRWHHKSVTYHGLVNIIPSDPSHEHEFMYRSLLVQREEMKRAFEVEREDKQALENELERLRKQLERERIVKLESGVGKREGIGSQGIGNNGGTQDGIGDGAGGLGGLTARRSREPSRESGGSGGGEDGDDDVPGGEYFEFASTEEWEEYNKHLLGMPLARFMTRDHSVHVMERYAPLYGDEEQEVAVKEEKQEAKKGKVEKKKGDHVSFDFAGLPQPESGMNPDELMANSIVYGAAADSFYQSLILEEEKQAEQMGRE
eukprot:TRINITY_DN68_c0_g1_i10.p1 TRINITY_DN68_c0_g1~~TRINITY_DN68_c0_g1_i10.p1  ORF type:complete len:1216 (-),score=382.55 TRINITY_DN68_c0_g1_i10:437-4084(-)